MHFAFFTTNFKKTMYVLFRATFFTVQKSTKFLVFLLLFSDKNMNWKIEKNFLFFLFKNPHILLAFIHPHVAKYLKIQCVWQMTICQLSPYHFLWFFWTVQEPCSYTAFQKKNFFATKMFFKNDHSNATLVVFHVADICRIC